VVSRPCFILNDTWSGVSQASEIRQFFYLQLTRQDCKLGQKYFNVFHPLDCRHNVASYNYSCNFCLTKENCFKRSWLVDSWWSCTYTVCLALFSLVNCLVYVIWRLTLCQPSVRECQTALIALDLMSCSWLSFELDHSQTQLDQHFCAESLVLLLTDCMCGRLARQWLTVYWSWRRRKVTEKDKRDAVNSFQERNSVLEHWRTDRGACKSLVLWIWAGIF